MYAEREHRCGRCNDVPGVLLRSGDRQVAVAAVLPEGERDQRGHQPGREDRRLAEASGGRKGDRRADDEEPCRRLDRHCGAAREPAGEGVEELRPFVEQDAHAEVHGDHARDHHREVGLPGEPEALRERQLGVPLVVARIGVLDPEQRHEDPERERPVAEQAAADPRGDSVEREHRRRHQHDGVEEDDQRQQREDVRTGDPRARREHRRPEVADARVGEVPVTEQPGARVVPELVAALVEDPVGVADRVRREQHDEPLRDDQTGDDAPHGLCGEPPAEGACTLTRGDRLACDRHRVAARARSRDRYHAIVRASPSRRLVRASKPKSSAARVVSRRRRGCPFGIDSSHTIRPS